MKPERDIEDDDVHRYRMAVMLAYTGEWGNSTPEALAYLRSAAATDGKRPDGTFYFLSNKDVRATTRAPFFRRHHGGAEKTRPQGCTARKRARMARPACCRSARATCLAR